VVSVTKLKRMYKTTRLKLTALFVLVVLFISLLFSAIIYRDVVGEINRGYEMAENRIVNSPGFLPGRKAIALTLLAKDLEDSKKSVLLRLLVINGVILLGSAVASYILAGVAIRPLEEALMRQKRFVSDASHEIRTPLSVIKTEIEVSLLERKITDRLARETLGSTLEEVEKMQSLTSRLLTMSRLESGEYEPKMEKVEIWKLLKSSVLRFAKLAKSSDIEIKFDKKDDLFMQTDPGAVGQIIDIFLDNAIKYSKKSGHITVDYSGKKNGSVKITVSDDGVGIPTHSLPYIFDRLYQADNARSGRSKKGYGLGLSIAKQLSDSIGGRIEVKSKIGSGSSFSLVLCS
jgi:signal transduction histidine kinase